jgi:mRNA-degrading endonuclease RelE of RelBE toxin-antitoxin system
MPIRVELIPDAVKDLQDCQKSGFFDQFLVKLLRLEEIGNDAGLPLGGALARAQSGLHKIIVGDRTWRIVYRSHHQDTVATVLAIAKRDDAAVYELAARRLASLGGSPETLTLAAALRIILSPTKQRKRQ